MGKFKSFWLAILLLVFLSTSFAAGIERKDAVKDQSNTTGTVSFVITGVAPNGARTITSAHTTGSTVRYRAVNVDGSQWEDGEGVWTSATNTLTRVTVFASSNSGSLTNFTTSPISVLTVPTAKDFDVPDWAAASNVASASTVNLDAAAGGIVHITGTTTITGVTLTRGPRLVIFDGILTLTHNSTTNNLPGGASITTAAGDRAYYMSDGTTVYVADYVRAGAVAAWYANPTSANLLSAMTDETGTGALVFGTSPTLGTPTMVAINNGGTISVPSGTDTLVARATTDTLTNKTLTTPTISSITNGGTLTLPSGTDTLVGRATTDTLTNKTLTTPVISSISNGGTVNIPSGADTLVNLAGSQALTNKSYNGLTVTSSTGTLTVTNGKTLSASNTLALAGTDSTTMTFPPASASVGYINIPQNSQSAAYTTVLADAGKHIYHPSADTTARTFTIDSNANVAFAVGTAITFVNDTGAGVVTIAITTDTLVLAGAGTTGSRTLAAGGVATAIKITSTRWIISGSGLT